MLRFLDSFDHYDAASLSKKYNFINTSMTWAIDATAGRNGNGLRKTAGASATQGNGFTVAADEVVVGCAIKRGAGSAAHPIVAFTDQRYVDNRVHICVGFNSGGQIVVYQGTGTAGSGTSVLLETSAGSFNPDIWNYVEVRVLIADNTGRVIVNVNGVNFIDYTGDTYGSNITTAPLIIAAVAFYHTAISALSSPNVGTSVLWMDDIYICDVTGVNNNDFLGDAKIACIFPDDAGAHADFTPDSGVNFARVNEVVPDGDTSYVEGVVIGDQDSYSFDDIVDVDVAIVGIQQVYYSKKMDSGGALFKSLHRRGGVDALSTQEDSIPTDYGYQLFPLDTDPCDGNDWSVTKVNSIEAGMERTG